MRASRPGKQATERTKTGQDNSIDKDDMVHPLMRPYHIRLRDYEKTRSRIFWLFKIFTGN